jgi:hypothetical protein
MSYPSDRQPSLLPWRVQSFPPNKTLSASLGWDQLHHLRRRSSVLSVQKSGSFHDMSLYSPPITPVMFLPWRKPDLISLPRWRRTTGLHHLAYQVGPNLGHGFVGRERYEGSVWWVANNAGICVSVDVGFPLPRCCVWMPCPDELGLQTLEFLLGAKFVGLNIGE